MEKVIRTEEGGRRSRELIRVWRESYWPSEQMAERAIRRRRRRRRCARGERQKLKHVFLFYLPLSISYFFSFF